MSLMTGNRRAIPVPSDDTYGFWLAIRHQTVPLSKPVQNRLLFADGSRRPVTGHAPIIHSAHVNRSGVVVTL